MICKLHGNHTENPVVEMQMIVKKISKNNTKESEESKSKKKEELQNCQKTMNKVAISTCQSIFTLEVSWLNYLIESYRLAKGSKKPIYTLPTKDSLHINTQIVKGWKKMFYANGNQKKVGVAMFILQKEDLKKNTL